MGLVVGTIEAVTGMLGCPVAAWRIIPTYYYIKSAMTLHFSSKHFNYIQLSSGKSDPHPCRSESVPSTAQTISIQSRCFVQLNSTQLASIQRRSVKTGSTQCSSSWSKPGQFISAQCNSIKCGWIEINTTYLHQITQKIRPCSLESKPIQAKSIQLEQSKCI